MLLLSLATRAAAQAPPATDIYLAPLQVTKGPDGTAQWQVGAPVNVTHRPGYDNQPSFLPGGRAFLYTVIATDAQADIYRYDLATGASTRVTATPESEYSPTPLPDGRGFSVVRVEADSTQRLWAFDWDGTHPRLLLPGVKPVGYHAWIDSVTVALFVLGTPATLQFADLRTGKADTVARDVGRSPQRVPGRAAVSFVWRRDSTARWVAVVDVATRTPQPFAPLPDSADFHAWTPDGTLLVSAGTRVLRWDPQGARWVPIADFAAAGLTSISRLAVSPAGDRLAVVAIPAAR
jgi:WD40 repeat protein